MELSVVVPVHNVGTSVVATLQSLARLSPPPHEVIIIDDGSTDGSDLLVEQFVGDNPLPGLRFIHQDNAGVSTARNVGLEQVTGDYVLFLDADDTVVPSLVTELALTDHITSPTADVYCWRYVYQKHEAAGQGLGQRWGHVPTWSTGAETLTRMHIRGDHFVCMVSAAYRVSFLKEHALRFTPGCASGEDDEFIWKSLALALSVRFVDSVLSTYVWRSGSASNTIDVRQFDNLLAFHRASEFLYAQKDPHLDPIADSVREQELPRFVEYLKRYARVHESVNAWKIISHMERRNPGITRLLKELIVEQQRSGRHTPANLQLLKLSPGLWLARVRWQWSRKRRVERPTNVT